jgi:hypothetical protein
MFANRILRLWILPTTAAAIATLMVVPTRPLRAAPDVRIPLFRAFTATGYWNTPLPGNAPTARHSPDIIAFLKKDNTTNYIRLAGTGSTGEWGDPIFWAGPGDSAYSVRGSSLPSEFQSLRIPAAAQADPTSDAQMTVYDLTAGYVASLNQASYDEATDTWSASGGALAYLSSNGLDRTWSTFPDHDPFNRGHRGVPAPMYGVRLDEVQAGSIDHVLKIAVDTTKCAHVFPMTGDECGTTARFAPPEGARIRIKASVDLGAYHLTPAALVIARAMQNYGAVIGDQGGTVTLKVENTVAEGQGQLWAGKLSANSLSAIPLDDFEVVKLGYGA